jgi:hypothetical protein
MVFCIFSTQMNLLHSQDAEKQVLSMRLQIQIDIAKQLLMPHSNVTMLHHQKLVNPHSLG